MAITTTTPTGLTVDDLEAMPDDGRRYELIDGAIVMTPAPEMTHQRISHRLQRLLEDAAGAEWEVFTAPTDLDLPGGNRVEPDLIVVEAERTGARLSLPVLLLVEIVSGGSRTHDRVTKRAAYAEAGVPAYWLVDTLEATITCLRLAGDAYEPYAEGPVVDVDWPVKLQVDLAALASPKVPRPRG